MGTEEFVSRVNRRRPRPSDERGLALVIAMVIMGILALLGSAALLTSSTELEIAANQKSYQMTFYGADAGTELGIRVVRDTLALKTDPDYSGSGVTTKANLFSTLLTNDGVVDTTDIQAPALTADLQVGIAVDRDTSIPSIPIGGQLPEPGSGYGGEKATYNYYFDYDSQAAGPRSAAVRITSTYKCAYDVGGCLRDQ
jgi:Tfp pilus assembly protein PilX